MSIPQIVDGTTFLPLETTRRKNCDFSVFHKVNCPYCYGSNYLILFNCTYVQRSNEQRFPSRKMRDCELAHMFCFWKLFRSFTGKMTRGLSLRMVLSLLFQDTLFFTTDLESRLSHVKCITVRNKSEPTHWRL